MSYTVIYRRRHEQRWNETLLRGSYVAMQEEVAKLERAGFITCVRAVASYGVVYTDDDLAE